jgi:hypothetical protein
VIVFLIACVILSLLKLISVQKSDKKEEQPMKKKTLALTSAIETIWAMGVSYMAGILST